MVEHLFLLWSLLSNVGISDTQIFTNGKLKTSGYRMGTNSKEARNSGRFFIIPAKDYIVELAKALVNPNRLPLFKPIHCLEYLLCKNRGVKS